MYKLGNADVKLTKVTPSALKSLNELGIYKTDMSDVLKASDIILDIYIDEVKLKKLTDTIFTPCEYDFNDVDLSVIVRGYYDFFAQLNPNKIESKSL